MEMFISFFTGKVMLFYGISLIMKEKSNASALGMGGAAWHRGRIGELRFWQHMPVEKAKKGGVAWGLERWGRP